jgi:3D (Asp-Asp-Asp) domain-containing protein
MILGETYITHYHIALEWDPQFPANDKVPVSGLDQSKRYRRQFIYSFAGIYGQGTGKSEDGTYITINHTKNKQEYGNDWLNTNPARWYFIYGKGGRNKNPIPWKTVAMNEAQTGLNWNDRVEIEGYSQTFEVTDTGTFPDTEHLDVFLGEVFHQDANQYGTVYRDVWKVIGN